MTVYFMSQIRSAKRRTIITDDEDIVELLHSVDLRQQLVNHSVVHTCAAGACTTLLTDGVQFIKDDDVQTAVSTQLHRNTHSITMKTQKSV